jgi:hypothetical protein
MITNRMVRRTPAGMNKFTPLGRRTEVAASPFLADADLTDEQHFSHVVSYHTSQWCTLLSW